MKIETGIPLPIHHPSANNGINTPTIYPFKDMEIGDSFLIEGEDKRLISRRLVSAKRRYEFTLKRKYITRMLPSGVRCWRIS